jgi:hypothetical protein
MLFSGLKIKKPPSLAVLESCVGLSCLRVNLPLLHRRSGGMAKVKPAGKQGRVAHGSSEWVK